MDDMTEKRPLFFFFLGYTHLIFTYRSHYHAFG